MGLRMFREPESTEPKSTTKTDPLAPARSTIRRQRTVRYHPHIRDHSSSSRSRTHGRSREADRRSLLAAIRRGDSGVGSTRLNDNDDFDIEVEADIAHAEASQRRRLQSGRALLRDALSYERPGRRMRAPRGNFSADNMAPPRPTVPDNRRYLEARSGSRQSNTNGIAPFPRPDVQSPVSEYMPTPPYTSGDASNGSSPLGSTAPIAATSLTPRFAPAHRLDDTVEMSFREFVARQGIDMARGVDRPRSADLDEIPTLRRTERRGALNSSRASREAASVAVDGLGDRRRSFSPEDDTWETLLTTMTPDDRLPSVHSSFTSATASASSLSSNSTSSYGTLATAPSTATETLDNAYPTICDNTDSEGSGTEIEHNIDGEDSVVEDFRARESSTYSSTHAHAHAPRTSRHLDHAEQHDRQRRIFEREEELRRIQANLDRLERQVPQEWWVAAGLERRNFHGRAGRERL